MGSSGSWVGKANLEFKTEPCAYAEASQWGGEWGSRVSVSDLKQELTQGLGRRNGERLSWQESRTEIIGRT